MNKIYKLQVVQFESLSELKGFVDELGHAEFYDDFEGDYIPIRTDADDGRLVLGSDAWADVEQRHLPNIYGFLRIEE